MENIFITGGSGFLGNNLINSIIKRQCNFKIYYPARDICNLYNETEISEYIKYKNINIVVHLAADVGGIGYNMRNPYNLFYNNMKMGLNIINSCKHLKIDKIVFLGTTCGYPENCKIPFSEEDFFNGMPEITNSAYGVAKRSLYVLLKAMKDQYNIDFKYLIPTNMYGPHDDFSLEDSHVIPALINKVSNAIENNTDLEVWGNGDCSRDFVYVEDCCDAIIKAINVDKEYHKPINIGSGEEIKIKDIVNILCKLMRYEGNIIWNDKYPNGQNRRLLSNDTAKDILNYKPKYDIYQGLAKTIEWFYSNIKVNG